MSQGLAGQGELTEYWVHSQLLLRGDSPGTGGAHTAAEPWGCLSPGIDFREVLGTFRQLLLGALSSKVPAGELPNIPGKPGVSPCPSTLPCQCQPCQSEAAEQPQRIPAVPSELFQFIKG